MDVIVGSARIDENKRISGGRPGDQTQQNNEHDYKGEVSQQPFYIPSKGLVILRAKNPAHALGIANAMITACDNIHVGYNQGTRLDIITYGTKSTVDIGCDCSSLIRACVKEGTGVDPGNFNTATEKKTLLKTGLFDEVPFTSSQDLYIGDILVTKTKGHTLAVTQAKDRSEVIADKSVEELDKALEVVAKYVVRGTFGNGAQARKDNIYQAVQNRVNAMMRGGKR